MQKKSLFSLGLLIVCACFFMTSLDVTIVNVALPIMTSNLHAPLSQVIWVVDGYLLIFAALSVPAGRLGDIIGQRWVFVFGLIIFTLASLICGLSREIYILIGARVLQGIGGACISSTSLVLLTTVVPNERRGAALGIYASMVALAGVFGPIVGGLLIAVMGWSGIFFINLPLGVLLVIGTLLVIPHVKIEKKHRFDVVGVVLGVIGIFFLVFSLIEGPAYNWGTIVGPLSIPAFVVAGLVFMVLFALWERVQKEPFLPLSFFNNWAFSGMILVNIVLSIPAIGIIFMLTLYLESAIQLNALMVGLTMLPYMLSILIVSPFAGRLVDKFGGRPVLICGMLVMAAGLGLLSLISRTTSDWLTLLLPLTITGVGFAFTISAILGEILRGVAPAMMGAASGIISTTRLVGGTIGIAIISSFLQGHLFALTQSQLPDTLQQIPADQRVPFTNYIDSLMQNNVVTHTTLTSQFQQLAHHIYADNFVNAFQQTLLLVAFLIIAGAVIAFTARPHQIKKEEVQVSAS